MWTIEFSFRFGREKPEVDRPEAPEYIDLMSGQHERADRVVGFGPTEGWED